MAKDRAPPQDTASVLNADEEAGFFQRSRPRKDSQT
jgi:hypothetical protein